MYTVSEVSNRILREYNSFKFRRFENTINKEVWDNYQIFLDKCEEEFAQNNINQIDNSITKYSYILREKCLSEFYNKYSEYVNIRILIHCPTKEQSPAGYSTFMNFESGFNFLGIETRLVFLNEDLENVFTQFKPTIFLSSDSRAYLKQINWSFINEYKQNNNLKVGLTAAATVDVGISLEKRLVEHKRNNVDFFFSFISEEFIYSVNNYQLFFDYGYKIISMEFGANPLLYYPIANKKELDFIFLASSNVSKVEQYKKYYEDIFKNNNGFIAGTGWKYASQWPRLELNRYLFSKAKVGLNMHIKSQIEAPRELNERTYILAASGIPQLIDNPKLLFKRFSKESVFSAENEHEYNELFYAIKNGEIDTEKNVINGIKEIYLQHTTFHRTEKFILEVMNVDG